MDNELLTYIPWALLSVAFILVLLTLIWLERPLLRVGSCRQSNEDASDLAPDSVLPKVSVIVYSQVAEESLMEYLSVLCAQDYPDFEVIVVCESTAEGSDILAESCTRCFDNVYVTFIPPGSHNLSRRKLALTIGMKAAKGEIVVTTVANAAIPSQSWLSNIIAPFTGTGSNAVEVSLGYSHFDFSDMKGWGKWYREFVSVITDATWIGYALSGKPYRGDGNNLAFRRKLFFEHKGYSQSIYLHSGDDDLFIHEIATPQNTVMVLNRESILSTEWGEASRRMWRERKEQYDFTSRWLPKAPFLRAGAVSTMQWAVLLLCAAAGISGYFIAAPVQGESLLTSLVPAMAAAVLLTAFHLSEIIIYRRTAENMGATRLWWALPLFRLAKPLLNAAFRLRHRRHRRQNYTWMR